MASIAKVGTPSISTAVPGTIANHSGLRAGEAIAAGDACYIKNDGLAYRSNGTTVGVPAARVDGFAATSAPINEAVSLYFHVAFYYGANLVPGALVYLDTVAGGLSDAATVGGTVPIGMVLPDVTPGLSVGGSIVGSRIWVRKSY